MNKKLGAVTWIWKTCRENQPSHSKETIQAIQIEKQQRSNATKAEDGSQR